MFQTSHGTGIRQCGHSFREKNWPVLSGNLTSVASTRVRVKRLSRRFARVGHTSPLLLRRQWTLCPLRRSRRSRQFFVLLRSVFVPSASGLVVPRSVRCFRRPRGDNTIRRPLLVADNGRVCACIHINIRKYVHTHTRPNTMTVDIVVCATLLRPLVLIADPDRGRLT